MEDIGGLIGNEVNANRYDFLYSGSGMASGNGIRLII
jgi:hypothetical protein